MTREATQLVRASDIARARIAANPEPKDGASALPMLRYFTELFRATDEKRRGEWKVS